MNGLLFEFSRNLPHTPAIIEWISGLVVILIGVAFFFGMRRTPARQSVTSILDRVSNNNRVRIMVAKRIYDDIRTIVEHNASNPAIKVIGTETLQEADLILDQCVKMLGQRDAIVKSGLLDQRVEQTPEKLRAEAESAASDAEKASLESAASAYEMRSGQAEMAKKALDRIDAGIEEAEAALGLMKSKLNAAALGTEDQAHYDEEFRESIMRLRSLSTSLAEAQELERELGS